MTVKDAYQQNPVSAVVWPWPRSVKAAGPDAARARIRRMLIQFVAMMVVAPVLAFKFESRVLAGVVLALALFVLISGLWLPTVFDAFHRGLTAFGRWVGVALTWLLLVPFFYIVFVPARVILSLRGRDPMKRRFPGEEKSYWIPCAGKRSADSYRRQF